LLPENQWLVPKEQLDFGPTPRNDQQVFHITIFLNRTQVLREGYNESIIPQRTFNKIRLLSLFYKLCETFVVIFQIDLRTQNF